MLTTEMVHTAQKAAYAGGKICREYFRSNDLEFELKGETKEGNKDWVSIADRESEVTIRTIIQNSFKDHSILGEEYGLDQRDSEYIWIIDPLDGTKAFKKRQPESSVSVALAHQDRIVAGVIYDFHRDDIYVAFELDSGYVAMLNSKLIEPQIPSDQKHVLYDCELEGRVEPAWLSGVAEQNVGRSVKSLALQLARVASSQLDIMASFPKGYTGQIWDLAAAQILLRATGGYLGTEINRSREVNHWTPKETTTETVSGLMGIIKKVENDFYAPIIAFSGSEVVNRRK